MSKWQFNCLQLTMCNMIQLNAFMYMCNDPTVIFIAKKNLLKNFDEFLVNLFMPLYEVSINPKSHPKLHKFLQQVRTWVNMIQVKFNVMLKCIQDLSLDRIQDASKLHPECVWGVLQRKWSLIKLTLQLWPYVTHFKCFQKAIETCLRGIQTSRCI